MPARREERHLFKSRLADTAGLLLFHKRPIRRLLSSRALAIPAAILVFAVILSTTLTNTSADLIFYAVLLPALALFYSAFWIIASLSVLEPILTLMSRLAEDDPLMLHWAGERKPEARTACLSALAAVMLLRGILLAIVTVSPLPELIVDFFALPLGFALVARIINTGWRFSYANALVIATAPAVAAGAMALALTEIFPTAAVAILILALLWPATTDMRLRNALRRAVKDLLDREKIEPEEVGSAILRLACANDPQTAEDLIDRLDVDSLLAGRPLTRMMILASAGRHLDAAALGVQESESGDTSAELHLALAEACLRTDDPDDAAAHAEEAYELGGDLRALIVLAVACFGMGERDSGSSACRRIIALYRKDRKAGNKAIVREARLLLRNFGETSI